MAEFEYDPVAGSSSLLREYVWFDGKPVAVVEGGVVYFVRSDHIGRPVFATDGTGAKVWEATYLPFGGGHTSSGSPIALRFPGQWFQSESGLHQNWMRDYDPTTGRYIQADPLGLVDGASVYGYARQNPGRYVDPRGEQANAASSSIASASSVSAGSCPDPCSATRKRVRDAKDVKPRACSPYDSHIALFYKYLQWRELCAARRERDRICPSLPPRLPEWLNEKGEAEARDSACRNATTCSSLILVKTLLGAGNITQGKMSPIRRWP